MKCMYAQTRPRFILSSEGVLGGMEFEPMLTPREKSPLPKMSPEEDRTRDAVDSEPKHYQLSYSGPCLADLRVKNANLSRDLLTTVTESETPGPGYLPWVMTPHYSLSETDQFYIRLSNMCLLHANVGWQSVDTVANTVLIH